MSFERNERLYANFFVQQTLFIGNYITEMTVANPTVPLAHVLRLFTRSLKLAYRRDYALTRANVEDVWMPRKTFANRIYIYIRFPIFQLYLSRIASETLLLDKSSVSSSGSLEKNRVFTEGFST